MPSKSIKQHNLMEAAANGATFPMAQDVGAKVGTDFVKADKATGNFRGAKRKKMPMKLKVKSKLAQVKL